MLSHTFTEGRIWRCVIKDENANEWIIVLLSSEEENEVNCSD